MNPDQELTQLIKERFAELPQEVKDVISASDLKDKMRAVGDKYNLLLDKQGDLQRLILTVMLGFMPSSEFVPSIMKELNVNSAEAKLIANDVSEQIFAPIRTHLREWEEQAEQEQAQAKASAPTDLERLGDFTIDKTPTAGNETNGTTVEKRPDILEGVENPQSAKRTFVTNTEPLVDHLLNTPVTIPPQKINQPTAGVASDPYREPTN